MSFLKYLIILSPIILTSCASIPTPSIIQNKEHQYLTAKSIPPLKIPPGTASYDFHSYYPVSDRYKGQEILAPSIVPPGLYDK